MILKPSKKELEAHCERLEKEILELRKMTLAQGALWMLNVADGFVKAVRLIAEGGQDEEKAANENG